jgi:UDP-2,3-diacylglucosamine hydrolase
VNREDRDCIFVSDAHFTGREPLGMDAFSRFLDTEQGCIGRLVILGDLFEFLFGFGKRQEEGFPYRDYLPVLSRLRELQGSGVRITYFEGNHDFCVSRFFSDSFTMKVEVHPESGEEILARKRVFVAHGDLCNPCQWGYRLFRRMLKSRWSYGLIRLGGPGLARRIARNLSDLSYRHAHRQGSLVPPPAFRRFAHAKFLQGYDVVVLGHSHFPDQIEELVGGRPCVYFNVGDWAVHRSYLRVTPAGDFLLQTFSEALAPCSATGPGL